MKKEKNKSRDARVKSSIFPLSGFLLTFLMLGLLTTGQMFILQSYVDYKSLRPGYVIAVLCYWMFVAAGFILFTKFQFNKNYQKPMEALANATRRVASGDFSVYVPPRRLPDKTDYLDVICMDFNIMVEELGSIETLKTDFFSNVSHEIKTPLAAIQNYAQALKSKNLSDEQRESYIDTVIESSSRLSELISDILRLNKLEKQKLQPVREAFDLSGQLCEAVLRFEDLWAENDIEFVVDLEDRVTLETDESLLEMVWNNLLSNAVKFTPRGGKIVLTQTSTQDEVIVTLTDNGIGMDDETVKHIFDKFYQGDPSRATKGNGLGLALVMRILQLIDGEISVSSVLNRGTTFTVRIPVR